MTWNPNMDEAPRHGYVLLYAEEGDEYIIATGWWNNGIWAGGQIGHNASVTHWQPLPPPPEQVE